MVRTASYPVIWTEEPGGQPVSGELTVGPEALRLHGARDGRLLQRMIAYPALDGVRVGRGSGERLKGQRALVLERHDAPPLLLRPLASGLLAELADLLTELCARREPVERIAVVLPLKPGMLETARALVAAGPPFDPAGKSLARHEVFLTGQEAIFVFSGADSCRSVREIIDDSSLWPAAEHWGACLDGPPRLAESGYAWQDT